MSIGNLRDQGNQSKNYPWQHNVLKGLQCICDEVKAINIDTDDLEQLLADLIAELQNGIDVTIVNPLGQEPMVTSIPVVIASNQSGVPVTDNGGSITVDGTVALDASTLSALENITVQNPGGASAVNIQDGGNSITTDTTQLPASLGQTNMAGSVSVTLANNQLGIARTPGIIRPTGSGNVNSVATTFFSVSVANVGSANGTVLGATIKPGEVLNFSADAVNNYFTSFAYNATGTEFIIIYVG